MQNQKLRQELNKQYRNIAIPIILQGLLMGSVEIYNTIIVTGLGQNSIVSMGIVMQITFIFFLFNYGATNGISIFISQYIGKKDYKGLNNSLALSKIIICILIIIYIIVTIIFPEPLIRMFTSNINIISTSKSIFIYISIGTIARFISFLFQDTIRGLGLASKLLYINIVQIIINVSLSPILCYGLFGFNKLGVIGAIVSYDISYIFVLAMTIILLIKEAKEVEILFNSVSNLTKIFVFKVLRKMLPLLYMEVIWSIGIAYYSIILSWKGANYLASAQLTGSIISFFMTFYSAMNAATSTIIGRSLGQGEFEKSKLFTKWLLQYAVIIGLTANIILVVFARQLLTIFDFAKTLPRETLQISYYVLIARSARIGIGSIAVTIINGVLKAGGDTKIIPIIELGSIFIFGLGWSLIAYKLNLGVFYIALGMSIEQCSRLIFGYMRYKKNKWLVNLT